MVIASAVPHAVARRARGSCALFLETAAVFDACGPEQLVHREARDADADPDAAKNDESPRDGFHLRLLARS